MGAGFPGGELGAEDGGDVGYAYGSLVVVVEGLVGAVTGGG